MRIKKIVLGTVAAGGIGLASLGVGAGVASAAPSAPVGTHQQYQQTQTQTRAPVRQAPITQPGPVRRPDHRPFTFRGQRVTPVFDQHHHAWGFWFFGFWVPLA